MAIAAVAYELAVYAFYCVTGDYPQGASIDLFGMVIDALGVQAGWCFENPMVNNPTWYVSVLLLCYIVFYWVTKLAFRVGFRAAYAYVAVMAVGLAALLLHVELPFRFSLQ